MATVKFSGELRERIVNMAKSKFAEPLRIANESKPTNWGDRLYDTIFSQYQPILTQLPAWWLNWDDSVEVNRIGDVHVGIDFPLSKARPYPVKMPDDKTKGLLAWRRSSYGSDLILADDPAFAEFKTEVQAWRKRVEFVQKQQSEFADSVKQVIGAYVTLAPALKAWPPLWDLIPEDVKEKHKKIVEREKSAPELNVDLDRMTALASYSKIRGV